MGFRVTCFAAVISGCIASSNIAHATTIFTDFGPGNAFDHSTGWIVSGLGSSSGIAFSPAMPFSSSVEANLTQIDIAMANDNVGSSTVKTATLTLFTNTGGALGPALGSWTVTNILNINGGGPTVLSVTGISGVHLNSGGNYYLQASASGDADEGWYTNSIGLSGTLLILRSDETDPVLQEGTLGAFDIIGDITAASATPLPAALPLFAGGLGALGLLGWRRKKKAALAA
jgi:hypothetical protein